MPKYAMLPRRTKPAGFGAGWTLADASCPLCRLGSSSCRYVFHYMVTDGLTYLCMSDQEFNRSLAFQFLNDIRDRFQGAHQHAYALRRPLPPCHATPATC